MRFFDIGSAAGVARQVNTSDPKQGERRGSDRAWTGTSVPAGRSNSQDKKVPTLKAVNNDDGFWEEF